LFGGLSGTAVAADTETVAAVNLEQIGGLG
jgi:hypothetical protein